MQLVRVIQAGVDVDRDGQSDLDASRVTYWGWSLGTVYGMHFFAATPEVGAAVFSGLSVSTVNSRRLSPPSRSSIGQLLAARTPSLLNSEYGLTEIDGVPVAAPWFNENQPLRNDPAVVNTVPGTIAIQQVFDRYEWAGRNGNAMANAPLVRLRPVAGQAPRPVLFQFARGDQRAPNPFASELLRTAALEDRAVLYRHDLFYPTTPLSFQSTTLEKEGHAFHQALGQVAWQPIVIGAHQQAAQFLASDGATMIVPPYSQYWEVPVVPLCRRSCVHPVNVPVSENGWPLAASGENHFPGQ